MLRRSPMKHRPIVPLLFLVILVVTSVASASSPTIEGQVSGIELCPQSVCNSAIFAGVFEGTVGGKPAKGSFSVSVEHTDLPTTTGGTASITDGSWFMKT